MKTLGILVLVACLGFVSYRLVHVENQRYALLIGMCRSHMDPALADVRCLEHVVTRTTWFWHLFYGLGG